MSENLKSAIELKCSEIQPGQLKAEYKLAKAVIAAEAGEVAKSFSTYAPVPGFRRGKAPSKMVMSKFTAQIKEDLTRKVMTTAMDKFSEEQGTEVVAFNLPEGEKFPELELDQDFVFTLQFDVAPKFELPQYKGMKVEISTKEITEAEIAERIDSYKNMYAAYQDSTEAAAPEDMLNVSYTSDFILGNDASATLKRQVENDDNWLWLNEPEVIPGCIAALTGAVVGKEYTMVANYPADYREAPLAGQKVTYKVKVLKVQRRTPIASIPELCEKMNLENEAKLREQITESLKVDAETKASSEKREKIVSQLLGQVGELVIPPTLMAQETQKELRRIANGIVKNEDDAAKFKEEIAKHKADAEKSAKDRLVRLFVMQKIAKAENISVNENEVELQIKGMSRYYGLRANDLRKVMEENGGLEDMQMDMLVGKVVEFLASNAAK